MKSLTCFFLMLIATAALADPTSVVAPTGTTSVVTQADGTLVFIKPLIDQLTPYLVAAFGAIISAAGMWAAAKISQQTGIKISQQTLDTFTRAAETQAGVIFAKADSSIANASIDVHSPLIAEAANKVIERLPDAAKSVGMTPEKMADKIAGEIGKLQATAQAVPVAVVNK